MRKPRLSKMSCMFIICFGFAHYAVADQSQMQAQLVQAIQQLQQIKPLIAEAAAAEPADMKSSVHLTAFMGADGQMHNGVMEDLDQLQTGIEQIVNQPQIDPRVYRPISGDYIGSSQ